MYEFFLTINFQHRRYVECSLTRQPDSHKESICRAEINLSGLEISLLRNRTIKRTYRLQEVLYYLTRPREKGAPSISTSHNPHAEQISALAIRDGGSLAANPDREYARAILIELTELSPDSPGHPMTGPWQLRRWPFISRPRFSGSNMVFQRRTPESISGLCFPRLQ